MFPNPTTHHAGPQYLNVPHRVLAAMEFVAQTSQKTQGRIAVYESGSDEYPGQELAPAEQFARDAAADLIAAYFSGKMSYDTMEQAEVRRIRQVSGVVCGCFRCGPNVDKGCQFCRGTGRVEVYSQG